MCVYVWVCVYVSVLCCLLLVLCDLFALCVCVCCEIVMRVCCCFLGDIDPFSTWESDDGSSDGDVIERVFEAEAVRKYDHMDEAARRKQDDKVEFDLACERRERRDAAMSLDSAVAVDGDHARRDDTPSSMSVDTHDYGDGC